MSKTLLSYHIIFPGECTENIIDFEFPDFDDDLDITQNYDGVFNVRCSGSTDGQGNCVKLSLAIPPSTDIVYYFDY